MFRYTLPLVALVAILVAPLYGADEPDPKNHWAFKAPVRPSVPEIRNPKSEIRNDIDRFILARLEKEGLKPSPEADRVTLFRRLYLDLIGLPPTPKEVDAFLDRRSRRTPTRSWSTGCSASPHYGERWGRHWLDAARYADSDGYEKDKPRQRLARTATGSSTPSTATCPTTSSSSSSSPATCCRTRRRTRSSPPASSATR